MIHYELSINRSPREMSKQLLKALDEVTKRAVWLWHDKALPRHFKHGAALRYKYKKRTYKYQNYKRRKKGGPPALVLTGRSRDILTRSFAYTVRAVKGIATGKHIVGSNIRYFWMTTPNHPNKPMEMKTTTKQEFEWIGDYILSEVPLEMAKQAGVAGLKKKVR